MATRIGRPLDRIKEQFWRRTIADQPLAVNANDLIMLLDAVDLQSVKRRPRYIRNSA